MFKVNFKIFEENSSSRDAILDFAMGTSSLRELRKQMWDPRAKAQVDVLRKRGRERAMTAARRWCTQNGYDYKSGLCHRCGYGIR